ncbi:hypothetical protein TELCIR_22936, partial [Teladorsagia circumcincta]
MERELASRWRDLTSFLCESTREKWWKTIIEAYRPRPFRAIYDPIASDNAEKSAQLLHQFAQDTTLDSENYVADLVVASGSYSTDAHLTEGVSGDEDVHYLIDFDMAFLGDSEEQFAEHEKAQRKEYSHMSDDEYRKQREK